MQFAGIGNAPVADVACQQCGRSFGSRAALAQHTSMTHDNPAWVPGKAQQKRLAPTCPICGKTAQLRPGKYGMKAECCGLWSWDYKPLVDRETHRARILAHDAFDRLWKSGQIARGECYRRLQIATSLSSEACHISRMSAEQARLVVEIVRSGRLQELADA